MKTMTKNMLDTARELAVELTILTGELWTARPFSKDEPEDQRAYTDSATATFYFYTSWRSDRLSISASAPAGMREMKSGEKITCDPTRTPEAIARDIKNRLLTHAREHFTESRAYDLERRKAEAKKNLIAKLIMRYLPKEYQNESWCSETKSRHGYTDRIHARTTYDNLINIEINLPLKEALKLLKQLTQEN
jgi:hypothetical protein